MQQPHRRRDRLTQRTEERTTMTAAWRQLPVLILLILAPCRTVSSKSVDPTTQPLVSIASQPTDTRSVVLQESVDQTTQTLVSIAPQPTDTRSFVLKGDTTFKNVELLNPVNLSLECVWTGSQNKQPSITGYWRKDGAEVQDSRVTVNLKEQQYNLTKVFSIASEENLGNYTCVFGNEFEMYFILGAPQMGEIRDKPIVSYVGDIVVLICKMDEKKPKPNTWTWYKFNGTDREEISAATDPHRYLTINDGWKTKLKVKNVSEADSGLYHCGAVYNISTSMTHVELKVITIMEPLKPFISILIEVIILVAAILIYERSRSKKKEAEANGPNAEPKNAQPQTEDNGGEKSSSVRQRKA
ncbi:embigin [Fundulus heteroclitus]|uniref:embigin n=1 Tax=Fundulus heteroclitus TaxID=8078 RepID=UPI00165C20DB|nr:embigin [Fundulus heteroclitus]